MDKEKANEYKKAAKKVWGSTPAGSAHAKEYKKGTKSFFDTVFDKRFSFEHPWLDEIVQFDRFKNKNQNGHDRT